MANIIDSRPQFNPYPMPILTSSLPSSSKPHYNYAYATPASTPTKPYPSYFYHYRPASPSARSIRRTSASVPNLSQAASSPLPSTIRSSPLSVPPNPYSKPREIPKSRSKPSTDECCHSFNREDDELPSVQAQKHQQYTDAQARKARLMAEHAATLKRMEDRQRTAQSQTWFEEGQRLAAEAARIQQEELRRADEKLSRLAQERAEEERKMYTKSQKQEGKREHDRGRSQARRTAGGAYDKESHRDRSRDSSHKGECGFEREQRPDRERTKSEGPSHQPREPRKRVDKHQARHSDSPSAVAAAWAAYEEACTELMHAKPPKGKASGRVTFYDIPWPILGPANSFHDLTNEKIAAFLLSPHHSQNKSSKARLRAAILVWHPDKFAQKVSPHLADSHRLAVSAAVDIVARIITELISKDN
ncbi:hypothetical protein OPQ81_000934 [Rhizoctonia solani]|nr:hypothetical protein OPQ81_000934 [Rhizoctonia solani]